jgi:hypothetical protein
MKASDQDQGKNNTQGEGDSNRPSDIAPAHKSKIPAILLKVSGEGAAAIFFWVIAEDISVLHLVTAHWLRFLTAALILAGIFTTIHQFSPNKKVFVPLYAALCAALALFFWIEMPSSITSNSVSALPQPQPQAVVQPTTATEPSLPESKQFWIRQAQTNEFTISGEFVELKQDASGNTPLLHAPGVPTLTVRTVRGVVLVSAKLSDGIKSAEIQDNELVSFPSDWDLNFDGDSIEIVNNKHYPVFQIKAPRDRTIMSIVGFFAAPKNEVCVTFSEGSPAFMNSDSVGPDTPYARIFRYPSSQFPGQLFLVP